MFQAGAKERLGVYVLHPVLKLDEEHKNSTEGVSRWTRCHFTPDCVWQVLS